MTLPPDTYDYVRVAYQSAQEDLADSTMVLIQSDDDDESLVQVPVTIEVAEFAGIAGGDDGSRALARLQNYPNPFRVKTIIAFQLGRPDIVDLAIYNVEGKMVSELLRGEHLARGFHRVSYSGSELPPGVYFCRLSAGGRTQTRRMLHVHGVHAPQK